MIGAVANLNSNRANIGNARIQGMQEDLHLAGYRFNWALTAFYIPYLMLVPTPWLLGTVTITNRLQLW